MDLRDALHTTARRHCIERHAFWAASYRRLQASEGATVTGVKLEYSDAAYRTFPRFLVWWAMLDEIERMEARSVPGLDQLREKLAAAGRRAHTPLTANPELPMAALAAMTEEREAFASFVQSVPQSQLDSVGPLDLRRVLGADEIQQLWEQLNARWSAKKAHYWWPLREGTAPRDVVAFHTDWLNEQRLRVVRELLIARGIDRAWELREFGEWGAERAVSSMEFDYTGEEGYWASLSSDWVIYASHESSITLAGEWLVASFRQRFPECEQFFWEGPMSTPNQRGTWKL
jgi:hypothetical protein